MTFIAKPLLNKEGRVIPNHTVISLDRVEYLQSYSTLVARIDKRTYPLIVTLSSNWDRSRKSRLHVCTFLFDSYFIDVQEKIRLGEYKLADSLLI